MLLDVNLQAVSKIYLMHHVSSLLLLSPILKANAKASKFTALYNLYSIKQSKAHYVIVLDRSLSMKPIFPAVRENLLIFLQTLNTKDRLTLITFANKTEKIYAGQAAERLEKILPAAPDPQGTHTDMGAAFKAAIASLKHPEEINVLLFITDGLDDPPVSSQFKLSENWQKLQTEAQKLPLKHLIVYGLGLNQQTDVAQLKKVFPQPQIMTVDARHLKSYFQRLKEKLKQEKLKAKVADELKTGKVKLSVARVQTANAHVQLSILARSMYRRLPVNLDWQRVQVKLGKLKVKAVKVKPAKLTIAPQKRATFLLKLKLASAKPPLAPAKLKVYQGQLKLTYKKELAYQKLITALGLGKPKVHYERLNFQFRRFEGFSYLFFAGAFSLLVFTTIAGWYLLLKPTAATFYQRLKAPTLEGRLVFYAAPAGEKLPPPVLLKQYGSKVILGTAGDIKIKGPEIKPHHAQLQAVWEERKAVVYAQTVAGEIQVAAKKGQVPLPVKKAKLEKGAFISLGGYKIQWL